MSSFKRRQIQNDGRQTQISFMHSKNTQDSLAGTNDYVKRTETKSCTIIDQNGAKEKSTPYRSVSRVNKLLCQTKFQSLPGTSKLVETPTQDFFKKVDSMNDVSKPSSCTTACTLSPNDYSVCKSDFSKASKKKREQKKDKKNSDQKALVGSKRPPQMKLDQMEYFLRLNSKNAKFVAQMLKLRDKKTGQTYNFPLFKESQLSGMKGNPIVTNFDMTKLEVEYDYDTDSEQVTHSKKMLLHELLQAIDFFIKEDPIKLVDNVLL